MIYDNGITNTVVSLDQVALAPNGLIHVTDATTIHWSSLDDVTARVKTSMPIPAEDEHTGPLTAKKYFVDRILNHEDHSEGCLFLVRWYRHNPSAETLEPRSALPENFVRRNLRGTKNIYTTMSCSK